jgi:hypothetical protein
MKEFDRYLDMQYVRSTEDELNEWIHEQEKIESSKTIDDSEDSGEWFERMILLGI